MGMESYQLGVQGEEVAEKYLHQQGYQIVERNFHSQQGEVDIIARDGNFLVFVEVKSYSFRSLVSPVASVRRNKRDSIIHAARSYLYRKNIHHINCRFDVISIYRRRDGSQAVELYKDAFTVN